MGDAPAKIFTVNSPSTISIFKVLIMIIQMCVDFAQLFNDRQFVCYIILQSFAYTAVVVWCAG
jgi:hypothetical protein